MQYTLQELRGMLHYKRVLAFDIGTKWVGVAVCDALHISTRLLPGLERSENLPLQIAELVQKEQAGAVVIGVPLRQDKKISALHADILDFIRILREQLSVPVIEQDEAFSTERALDRLRAAGVSAIKRRDPARKDGASAGVILSDFLDLLS